ncbi:hypothetical protein ES705_50270 [subsurface metagenome]
MVSLFTLSSLQNLSTSGISKVSPYFAIWFFSILLASSILGAFLISPLTFSMAGAVGGVGSGSGSTPLNNASCVISVISIFGNCFWKPGFTLLNVSGETSLYLYR